MAGAIALWWLRSPCGGWCRCWLVPVVGCLVGAGVLMSSAPSFCIAARPKLGIRPAQKPLFFQMGVQSGASYGASFVRDVTVCQCASASRGEA